MQDYLLPIICTCVSVAVTWWLTWLTIKGRIVRENRGLEEEVSTLNKRNRLLENEIEEANSEISRLAEIETAFDAVNSKLSSSGVVNEYFQPVILVGPKNVGKSSLVAQWHHPWDMSPTTPTSHCRTTTVPFQDIEFTETQPHFANPDIQIPSFYHLKLRVHDFPGEMSAQEAVIQKVKEETLRLRQETKKNLGVVLVCMFDSSEAFGKVSNQTREYYNGDLFRRLRSLNSSDNIKVEKIILVFNKQDIFLQMIRKPPTPNASAVSDAECIKQCLNKFDSELSLLKGICSPEKFTEVVTILQRDVSPPNNKGEQAVLGEVARNFVASFTGSHYATEKFPEKASNYALQFFAE